MRFTSMSFGGPTSTSSHLLSTVEWSSWALASTKFLRVAYRPYSAQLVANLGSTAVAVGEYIAERRDSTDAPQVFNYNSFADIRTSVGRLLGPSRPTTFLSHRSSNASSWFDSLSM